MTKSKAVTAEEAARRLQERRQGTRKFLEEERGLGKPKLSPTESEPKAEAPEFEAYGDGRPEEAAYTVPDQVMVSDPDADAYAPTAWVTAPPMQEPVTMGQARLPSELDTFKRGGIRVALELGDGTVSLPALAVKTSKYAVVVVMALDPKQMAFVPKPGAELDLAWADNRKHVYFPGTWCELGELGLCILAFVVAEESK